MNVLRLHLNVRANCFAFTVQRVGSHPIILIVAIYSGCAFWYSLFVQFQGSRFGDPIFVKELNPHFQLVMFFPFSKFHQV